MRLSLLSELLKIRRDAKENLKVSYDFQKNKPKLSWPCSFIVWPIRILLPSKMREADLREQIATLAAIIGDERTMFKCHENVELRDN